MEEVRKKFIHELKEELKNTDCLKLMPILGLEFFILPQNYSESEFGIRQSVYEYLLGLISKFPRFVSDNISKDKVQKIKNIALEIFFTYFNEYLPTLEEIKAKSDEVIKKYWRMLITSYYLFVRGEGYPDQLWRSAIEIYSPLNTFLKAKIGLNIKEIVEICKFIIERTTRKGREKFKKFAKLTEKPMKIYSDWLEKEIDFEELNKKIEDIISKYSNEDVKQFSEEILDIFSINKKNFEKKFGKDKINSFLKRFSYKLGDINKDFESPLDFNEINSTPIIEFNDFIFIPIPMLLWQIPINTLHYDLIQDPKIEPEYSERRGKYLENKSMELFSKIFGKDNIFINVFYGPKKEKKEGDNLVIFDNKLFIIECKSKKLTLPAKQGNFEKIEDDFKKGIQSAFDQALRFKKFIQKNSIIELETENKGKIKLQTSDYNDIFIICLTSDIYSSLTTNLSFFLQKEPNEPYPWATSIGNLEILVEYLNDPYHFIQFLVRRSKLHGKVFSIDELDFVGCYLSDNRLWFEKEFKRGLNYIMLTNYTEQFDKDYFRKQGSKVEVKIGLEWNNPTFDHLLNTIRSLNGKGYSDIILLLIDLDLPDRDLLMEQIKSTTDLSIIDKQYHDFALVYDNFGISFISGINRIKLQEKISFYMNFKKYQMKCKTWLGLTRDIDDPNYIVNDIFLIENDWKYDEEMEKIVKQCEKLLKN